MAELIGLVAPRTDYRQLRAFLAYHGSLGEALAASRTSLERHFGEGSDAARFIPAFKQTMLAALREDAARQPLSSTESASDYLQARLAHQTFEQFMVLFIDSRGRFVADLLLGNGGLGSVEVHARAIMVHALEKSAQWIVLAHNHPSGDPEPSKDDIRYTRDIVRAGRALGIYVHDHIIVGRNGVASMRELHLL